MRFKFKKGEQRKFILKAMEISNCPSLGELSRRLDINYATLKNYFSERRLLSGEFFENLCLIGEVKKENLNFEEISEFWGQVKGGKKSQRN